MVDLGYCQPSGKRPQNSTSSPVGRTGSRATGGSGADSAAELLIVFGDNPERIRSEAASWETLRHLPHPGFIRTTSRHRPLPRRAPTSQRGALPSSHRSHAFPPTYHRLRRSPHHHPIADRRLAAR